MRCCLIILLALGCTMKVSAATFVYVSMAPEKKIQIFRLEAEGKLVPVEQTDVTGNPGALAVDPTRAFLFASLRDTGELVSFRIDAASGKLKRRSAVPLGKGENAAFVGTDRSGRWLLSASYSAGKTVVHGLTADGAIRTPAVESVTTTKTAHAAVPDPGNRFVFVPHVAPNAVYQFRFDADAGKLQAAGKAPGGASKAGPRHIAFHPTLPMAYTSDEEGSSITAYRFDAKSGLTPTQTLSTLPSDFTGGNTTAEVMVHPSGKFVWVSNRGHDSLAGFAIDDAGKLTSLGQTPTEKTVRSFTLDPSGQFLLAAGEGSGRLQVYQVDRDRGVLTPTTRYEVGKSLTWVLAVQTP